MWQTLNKTGEIQRNDGVYNTTERQAKSIRFPLKKTLHPFFKMLLRFLQIVFFRVFRNERDSSLP